MKAPTIRNAALAATLAVGLVSLASPARADHGRGRGDWNGRHRREERVWAPYWRPAVTRVVYAPPVVVRPVEQPPRVWVRPPSGLSVSFSGLVGGVAVGARYDRPLPDGYVYEDPYCGITFDSLEGYAEHSWHRHPAVADIVTERGGCERHDWRGREDDDDDEDWGR